MYDGTSESMEPEGRGTTEYGEGPSRADEGVSCAALGEEGQSTVPSSLTSAMTLDSSSGGKGSNPSTSSTGTDGRSSDDSSGKSGDEGSGALASRAICARTALSSVATCAAWSAGS